jgi:hypothetical protein
MRTVIGLYSNVPRSGKTTVANRLIARHLFMQQSLARPLKLMLNEMLLSAGFTMGTVDEMLYGDKKLEPIPIFGNKTPRQLMQLLGTDWGRNMIDQDIWLNIFREHLSWLPNGAKVVVDDVRFQNEATMLKALPDVHCVLWRVVRPPSEDSITYQHASEGGLDDFNFDAVIMNTGTMYELTEQVDKLVVQMP